MNKTFIKLSLPLLMMGVLAGCSGDDAKIAEEAVHSLGLYKTSDAGQWVNDESKEIHLSAVGYSGASDYLVFFPYQTVQGKKVKLTYTLDNESVWKKGIVSLDDPEERVKLTPIYKDDGSVIESSITLKAKVGSATKTATYKFSLEGIKIVEGTIADLYDGTILVGAFPRLKGIVTKKYYSSSNGIFIADGDRAVMLYRCSSSLNVGDAVEVVGEYTVYNGGLAEINVQECTKLSSSAGIATPVDFEATIATWDSPDLRLNSARVVNFHHLKVTEEFLAKKASSSAYVVSTLEAVDPDNPEITLKVKTRYNKYMGDSNITSINNKLNTLEVGDFVDIIGAVVDYDTKACLGILSGNCIVKVSE